MITQRVISTDLDIKVDGNIYIYQLTDVDAIKEKIKLYLNVTTNESPMSNYGNDIIYRIFQVNNDALVKDMIIKLTNDLNRIISGSRYAITKNEYVIDRDARTITFNFEFNNGVANLNYTI